MSERSGRDREAERALGKVFRALPLPVPGRDLVAGTLAELGLALPPAAAASAPHWAFRWAVAMALSLSGLATALIAPALLSTVSFQGSVNWIVDLGAGLLAGASRRLAAGVAMWEVLDGAAATATEILATP